MTVLTTCIWIGFKVSYAPLKVLGSLALRVLFFFYVQQHLKVCKPFSIFSISA